MTYENGSSPCKSKRTKIDVIDVYASFQVQTILQTYRAGSSNT